MNLDIDIKCLNNGVVKAFRKGVTVKEILDDLKVEMPYQIVGAKVNNQMRSLSHILFNPRSVEFVDLAGSPGQRAYIRSLAFLLYKAIKELYPTASFRIEHPISKGYYCIIKGLDGVLTSNMVEAINGKMDELIALDIPFEEVERETAEVIEMFAKDGREDIVKLLKSRGELYTKYFKLGDLVDFYYGALLPSTGYIKMYDLVKYYDGILIRVPSRSMPTKLESLTLQDKLFDVFTENAGWNSILGVSNVGDLNEGCCNGKALELIKITEALHEKKVASIADAIVASGEKLKVVLVAGPSSSGKTTFSKRLAIQLLVAGKSPVNLSLDDYFVDREQTPKDEDGNLDFESIYAIDLDFFSAQLNALLAGKEIDLPTFSFAEGKRLFKGKKLQLQKDDILIIEGIHGLNPLLTQKISADATYKIYVSSLTTISLDDHNWIPTSDNRLLRRILRDFKYRGYSAKDTIARWPSVRKGEEKWIYPYQEEADVMFNSALLFELAVLKNFVEPILQLVPQNCEEYAEAYRLLRFLSYFHPIRATQIPPTSLLREFVGGSSFSY